MRVERRIRALEARFSTDPLLLFFSDGTTRQISGRGAHLLRLLRCAAGAEDASPRQAEQLEWIRRSTRAHEPGGGHLIELIRCLQDAPADEQSSLDPVVC